MIDRTYVGMITIIGGKVESRIEEVLFKDIKHYEHFPDPCKCESVKKDFSKFKEYETSLKVAGKLEKQIGRFY